MSAWAMKPEWEWRYDRLQERFGDIRDEKDPVLYRQRLERIIATVVEGFCPYDNLPLVRSASVVKARKEVAGCAAGHFWMAGQPGWARHAVMQAEEVCLEPTYDAHVVIQVRSECA